MFRHEQIAIAKTFIMTKLLVTCGERSLMQIAPSLSLVVNLQTKLQGTRNHKGGGIVLYQRHLMCKQRGKT